MPGKAEPTRSFEDQARVLLANIERDHPMLTPELAEWIKEACRRLGIDR